MRLLPKPELPSELTSKLLVPRAGGMTIGFSSTVFAANAGETDPIVIRMAATATPTLDLCLNLFILFSP